MTIKGTPGLPGWVCVPDPTFWCCALNSSAFSILSERHPRNLLAWPHISGSPFTEPSGKSNSDRNNYCMDFAGTLTCGFIIENETKYGFTFWKRGAAKVVLQPALKNPMVSSPIRPSSGNMNEAMVLKPSAFWHWRPLVQCQTGGNSFLP